MSLRHRNMDYIPIDSSNAMVLTEKPGQGVDADLFYFTGTEEGGGGYVDYYLVGTRASVDRSPSLLYYATNSQAHPEFRPFMLYNDANKEIFFCTESTDQDVYMHCYTIDVSKPPPSAVKKVAGPFLPPRRPRPGQNEQDIGVRNVQVLKTFEDEIHILATAGSPRAVVLYRVPGFENLVNPDAWSPTLLVVDPLTYEINECEAIDPATRKRFKPETRALIVGYDSELGYLVLAHNLCYPGTSMLVWIFRMFYYDPVTNAAYDLDGSTRLSLPIDISSGTVWASPPHPPGNFFLIGAQIFGYNVVRDNNPRGQGRIYVPLSSVFHGATDKGMPLSSVFHRATDKGIEYTYARAIIEVDEKTKQGSTVVFNHISQASTLPFIHIHGRVDDTKALVTLGGGESYKNVLRQFDISTKTMGSPIAESLLGGVPRILLGTKKFNLPVEGLYISSSRLAIADGIWNSAKKTVTDLNIIPIGSYSVRLRASFWEAPQSARIEVINDKGIVEKARDISVRSTSIDETINVDTAGKKRFRLKVIS